MNARSLAVLLGVVFTLHGGAINLQNGNFLLTSGNLLVQVDRTGNVVDGAFLPITSMTGVALDSRGVILVASGSYPSPQAIYTVSTNGVILSTNVPPVLFDSFASAPNGDFLLGQGTTIYRVDSSFNFVDVFSIPPAQGSAPSVNGIGVGTNGQIYVAAWSQNGQSSAIQKLDAQGNFLQSLGPFAFEIRGLIVETNGHLFYGRKNHDNSGFPLPSQIVELDPNGSELGTFNAPIQVAGMTLISLPRRPSLSIRHAVGDLILEWPLTASDYELQTASINSPQSWSAAGIAPVNVGGIFQIKVPMSATGMLFRLRKLL